MLGKLPAVLLVHSRSGGCFDNHSNEPDGFDAGECGPHFRSPQDGPKVKPLLKLEMWVMLVDLEKGLKKRGAQSGEVRVHGKQVFSKKLLDFEGWKGNEIGLEKREYWGASFKKRGQDWISSLFFNFSWLKIEMGLLRISKTLTYSQASLLNPKVPQEKTRTRRDKKSMEARELKFRKDPRLYTQKHWNSKNLELKFSFSLQLSDSLCHLFPLFTEWRRKEDFLGFGILRVFFLSVNC